jgi:CheY-like chemotaxis protein/two-component sensor histidine kinase
VIDRQLVQMSRLIGDLIDMSRITRNQLELRKEVVDLADVVQGAIEASRPLIESRGHTLEVSLPPGPVFLEADATRLSQVLLNLLNNAAKYTERGGRITLAGERNDGEVVLRVTDTGIGIPAQHLPGIFEMFTQVDRSLEKSHGGLGIGLTLVKRLVEMHGGTVAAASAGPGLGSEFTIRMPESARGRAVDENRPDASSLSTTSLRILVADDNRDAADTLGVMLRTMGHDVRVGYDGEEAVGLAAEFQPQIVFLDIGMPRLNGIDACRRIRSECPADGMVLVALTGWGQDADRVRTRDAGFDHHVVKPVDHAWLVRLLAERHSAGG